jgi:acyl-CoA thioester hydrolase
MLQFTHELRVRYADTDRMGYVYYGNYATYFEVARVEMLRNLGISYRDLEDSGVMLPVLEYQTKFFNPAYYDENITIKVEVRELPSVRITFHYKAYNEKGKQLNSAYTTLVFVDVKTGKPTKPPEDLISKFKPYF